MSASIFADEAAPPYSEKLRPQFHFTSRTDWINDPNGLVFFDNTYHLFFQRTVGSNDSRLKTWGHATSTDLVHWQQVDDAIKPDDRGDIWSGSAVVDWNNTSGFGDGTTPPLVAAYTCAGKSFTQDIAYSTDKGKTWTKFQSNPVIKRIHNTNRDPKIVWHAQTKRWLLVLYLDTQHAFGIFTSPNLKDWTELQRLTLEGDNECPDFFPIKLDGDAAKEKWVFTAASGRYKVGTFDGNVFTPETDSLESQFGPGNYAAQTYSDIPAADGRRIQIAWIRDGKFPDMPFNQQLSFPCELNLVTTKQGPRLTREPVKEIGSLYEKSETRADLAVRPGNDVLENLTGDCFDIEADVTLGQAESVTLNLRGFPVTLHSEGPVVALTAWDRRVSLTPVNGHIKLRALVDRTSIELFAESGVKTFAGSYQPRNNKITLTSNNAEATATITAHHLKSAWPITSNPQSATKP